MKPFSSGEIRGSGLLGGGEGGEEGGEGFSLDSGDGDLEEKLRVPSSLMGGNIGGEGGDFLSLFFLPDLSLDVGEDEDEDEDEDDEEDEELLELDRLLCRAFLLFFFFFFFSERSAFFRDLNMVCSILTASLRFSLPPLLPPLRAGCGGEAVFPVVPEL